MRFGALPGFSLLPYSLPSVKLIDVKYLNLQPLYDLKKEVLDDHLDLLSQSMIKMINTACNDTSLHCKIQRVKYFLANFGTYIYTYKCI